MCFRTSGRPSIGHGDTPRGVSAVGMTDDSRGVEHGAVARVILLEALDHSFIPAAAPGAVVSVPPMLPTIPLAL
jgi:hypothetical protein